MISVPERVKDALRDGRLLKNYRFNVLKSDGTVDFTIDNDTLVYESVKYDERMCSGDTLKFGLCEGSSLEFQYFDHDNINGRQIQSFIDVQYMVNSTQLTKTDNLFTIELPGTYQIIVPAGSPSFEVEVQKGSGPAPAEEVDSMNMEQTLTYDDMDTGNSLKIISSSALTVTLNRTDGLKFPLWYTIPMGYFTVKKCSRQASTGIQKVTAYNKLQSEYLDANIIQAATPVCTDYIDDKAATYAIRSTLLSDYSISFYERNASVYHLGYPNVSQYIDSFSYISFNLDGSSITYHPRFDATGYKWAQTDDLSGVYIEIGDMDIYAQILDYMVAQIYQAIYIDVANPASFWDSLKSSLYRVACVMVYFDGSNNKRRYYTTDTLYDYAFAAGMPNVRKLSELKYLYNASHIYFYTPAKFSGETDSNSRETIIEPSMLYSLDQALDNKIYQIQVADMSDEDLIRLPIENIENATLRQIMSSTYELVCKFGKLNRETDYFNGVELNNSALYPADTLYPANSLYPGGVSETSFKSWYSKLWTDTVGEQSFRNLIITYKGLDDNNTPTDLIYEKVINQDGTTDYVMDDNWLLKNQIWTEQQIADFADAMSDKMEDLTWFPFEMWAAGLPYIETGDMIEIIVGDETHKSYVLQRQLSGIQNLQDTYINGTLDIF